MAKYNRVTLVGNLCRDPEVRETTTGKTVADIVLAVNINFGKDDEVSFIDVTLWEQSAKFARDYLQKGSPCLVEGELKQERWETDGQKRSKVKVIGNLVQGFGRGAQTEMQRAAPGPVVAEPQGLLDEAPF